MVPSAGLRFDLSGGHEDQAAAIRFGLYERAERFMARNFITGERDIVELGASLGVISCELARQRRGVRQVSVEADPALAERTRRNLDLNGFRDVAVENVAIDYSGAETVRFSGDGNLAGKVADGGGIAVPAKTLSALLARHGIAEYDLVVDIEGAEIGIFVNDREALAGCRRIAIELDGNTIGGVDEADYIAQLGFALIYRHANCAVFERAAA